MTATATAASAQAAMERRVEEHKRWLVEMGDEIGRSGAGNKGWKSQGRILLEAARHETEPRVLLNLFRYQAARNKKTWRLPEDVADLLEKALVECQKRAGDDPVLTMELMRHLLLYTLRANTAFAKDDDAGGRDDD